MKISLSFHVRLGALLTLLACANSAFGGESRAKKQYFGPELLQSALAGFEAYKAKPDGDYVVERSIKKLANDPLTPESAQQTKEAFAKKLGLDGFRFSATVGYAIDAILRGGS